MLRAVAKGSSLPANTAWICENGFGDCEISRGTVETLDPDLCTPGEEAASTEPGELPPTGVAASEDRLSGMEGLALGLLTEMKVEVVKESKKSEAKELLPVGSPKNLLRLGLGWTTWGGVLGAASLALLKLGDLTIWDSKPSRRAGGWAPGAWRFFLRGCFPGAGSDLGGPTHISRVFSNTTVQKHQFFGAQPSSQSNSHIHT